MSWKTAKDKLKGRNLDEEFEKFLNESLSDESSTVSPRGKGKDIGGLYGGAKITSKEKPWWADDDDLEESKSMADVVHKSWIKSKVGVQSKEPIPEGLEDDPGEAAAIDGNEKIGTRNTLNSSIPPVSMSHDSLEDGSRPPTQAAEHSQFSRGERSNGSESEHVDEPSVVSDTSKTNEDYGTTSGAVTTGDDVQEPGLETLEEYRDKQRFFQNLKGLASGTLDYSELNKMLDADGTLRNPNIASLLDDGQPGDEDKSGSDPVSESNDHGGERPSISEGQDDASALPPSRSEKDEISYSDQAESQGASKPGLLDKVGLMESLDSTTGLRNALKEDRLRKARKEAFSPTMESEEVSAGDDDTVRHVPQGSPEATEYGMSSTAREIAELQRALLEAKALSSQTLQRDQTDQFPATVKETGTEAGEGHMILLKKNTSGVEEESQFHVKPTVSDVSKEPRIESTDSLPGFYGNQLSSAAQWKGMADLDQLERSLETKLLQREEGKVTLGMYQSNSSEMLLQRIMEDQEEVHQGGQKTPPVERPLSDDEDSPPTDSLRSIKAIAEARKKSIRVRIDTAVSDMPNKEKVKGGQVKKKKREATSEIRRERPSTATPKRSTPKSKPVPATEGRRGPIKRRPKSAKGDKGSSNSPKSRRGHLPPRSAVSSVSELAASVESFAGYLKTFTTDNGPHAQPSPIRHAFQGDDGPSLSKSFGRQQANRDRLAAVSRERAVQKELSAAREELEKERKRNEQLMEEMAVRERKLKREETRLKQESQAEARRLQQEIFVLKNELKVAGIEKQRTVDGEVKQNKDADVQKLQEEIRELESLLEGYHKENERLYEEMRAKAEKAKAIEAKMFDENQKLRGEVALLKEKLSQMSNVALNSGARIESSNVLQLQNEIKFYQEREAKFREEIKEQEGENEHLMTRIKNLEKEKNAFREKNKVVTHNRTEERQVAELERLQKKVKWFVENQELVDADRAALRKKTEEVNDLRALVERLQAGGADATNTRVAVGKGDRSRQEDAKRIRDLERQVKEMENIIKKRYPNSVPAIIYAAASVPTNDTDREVQPVKETKTQMFLEKRIRKMETELEEKDLDNARALRAVEQKYTSMQTHYDDYIQSLEKKLRTAEEIAAGGEIVERKMMNFEGVLGRKDRRITELEKEVKELNELLLDEKKRKMQSIDPGRRSKAGSLSTKDDSLGRQRLLDTIADKDARIQRLETALDEFMRRTSPTHRTGNAIFQSAHVPEPRKVDVVNRAVSPVFPAEDVMIKAKYEREVEEIRLELKAALLAQENTKAKLGDIVAKREAELHKATEQMDKTLQELIAKHDKEIERLKVDFALNHSGSKVAELNSQLESQSILLQHLKAKEMEAAADRELLAASRVREDSLRNQVAALKSELATARKSHTPEMHHFRQLELKITQMETRHAEREAELQRVIESTKVAASFEVEEIEEQWREALKHKDLEIQTFRNELDAIMQTLQELQRQGVVLSTRRGK